MSDVFAENVGSANIVIMPPGVRHDLFQPGEHCRITFWLASSRQIICFFSNFNVV